MNFIISIIDIISIISIISIIIDMSADKRSLTDFENMPGQINSDTNRYELPTLYKTAATGKLRQWTIYCRLIKEGSMNQDETKSQNWNMLDEDEVSIKSSYLPNGIKIPDGIISEMWSESGVINMKISRSPASYILVPKNLGKKNERNVLQQALIEMRASFLKKVDAGSSTDIDIKDKGKGKITKTTKFYPMLAKKYEDFIKKIKYPVYIQPKLDGNRCIVFLDNNNHPTFENVIMYTRSLKEYPNSPPNDLIRKTLLNLLIKNYNVDKNESIYLDGELYMHGKSLQEINSDVRGKSLNNETVQYWVYDHFYPSYEKESFKDRTKILDDIFKINEVNEVNAVKDNTESIIKLVPTTIIESEEACDKIYINYLADKYEGIMIRSPSGIYQKSATKKSEQLRSKDLLKRKEVYDSEFEVVDYTEGNKGKEIGAVIWICNSGNDNNDTFNVTPNLPIKERYEIYKECTVKFVTKYKNRLLTVQYRGFSQNDIPLQAKGIEFRDIK
jgi:ATP-dependent DNA ligase